MLRTLLTTSAVACMLTFAAQRATVALTPDAQNPVSAVGHAAKDAGKAVVKGTKGAVKTAGDVTQDAAKKTQDAAKKPVNQTKNAGKTVQGAVTPGMTSASCKDGTVQTGKTRTAACAHHGGVKK